jgi:hypothetical protein
MPMMAITTSSSTSVKAAVFRFSAHRRMVQALSGKRLVRDDDRALGRLATAPANSTIGADRFATFFGPRQPAFGGLAERPARIVLSPDEAARPGK